MSIREIKGCIEFIDEENTEQVIHLCHGCKKYIKGIDVTYKDDVEVADGGELPEEIKKDICHALKGITLYRFNFGE